MSTDNTARLRPAPPPRREPLSPLATAVMVSALAALVGGVLAWVWSFEWRWLVTGLLVGVLLVFAGAAVDHRSRGRIRPPAG